jgi:hypothetical protein
MAEPEERQDKGWCVLELMGHRKLAGYLTEDAGLLRIDVYENDPEGGEPNVQPLATQWYGMASIYCITATTRENCLALTATHQPAPIGHWESPPRAPMTRTRSPTRTWPPTTRTGSGDAGGVRILQGAGHLGDDGERQADAGRR